MASVQAFSCATKLPKRCRRVQDCTTCLLVFSVYLQSSRTGITECGIDFGDMLWTPCSCREENRRDMVSAMARPRGMASRPFFLSPAPPPWKGARIKSKSSISPRQLVGSTAALQGAGCGKTTVPIFYPRRGREVNSNSEKREWPSGARKRNHASQR